MNREHLGRKCATLAAVIVVAFLCGWSAIGLADGVVFALALGAATAAPVFSDKRGGSCPRPAERRRRTRGSRTEGVSDR